jgi:choline dehydrogenase-like flavoprotein
VLDTPSELFTRECVRPGKLPFSVGRNQFHCPNTFIVRSSADFVHNNPPPNLDLLLNTTALRIILEPIPSTTPLQYQAVGVQAEDTKTHEAITLRAKKEVILSAGAYNSPVILMHSGIGPKEHLEEVGIECKLDLKGVGGNLIDHLIVFSFYACKQNMT